MYSFFWGGKKKKGGGVIKKKAGGGRGENIKFKNQGIDLTKETGKGNA